MTIYIEDTKELAIFVAQLVREGVTFEAYFNPSKTRYEVNLTGGY